MTVAPAMRIVAAVALIALAAMHSASAKCVAGGPSEGMLNGTLFLTDKEYNASDLRDLTGKTLAEVCPTLEGVEKVCCSNAQFQFMSAISFLQLSTSLTGCDACNYAVKAMSCELACRTDQDQWYEPMAYDNKTMELWHFRLNVSQSYTDRMWTSCSGKAAMGPMKISSLKQPSKFLELLSTNSPPTEHDYKLMEVHTVANTTPALNPATVEENPQYAGCIGSKPNSTVVKRHPSFAMPTASVGSLRLQDFSAIILTLILATTFATKILRHVLKSDELTGSPINPVAPGSFVAYGAKE